MEKINKAFIGEDGYSFPNSKKRVGWIDITKGIAILFVVYSHSVNWENKLEAIKHEVAYLQQHLHYIFLQQDLKVSLILSILPYIY